MPSAFDGYYPDGYDDGDQSGTHAGKQPRMVNCEICQTEGRILTSDGGPDEIDNGPCPACKGECVVEVETQPIDLDDLHCSDCGQSLPLLYPCLQQGCPQ